MSNTEHTPQAFGLLPGGHPDYEKNLEGARHKGQHVCQTECCAYCGRKALNPRFYGFFDAMSNFTLDKGDEADFLGYYPLGPDCARKLVSAGVPVYSTGAKYGSPDFHPVLVQKKAR